MSIVALESICTDQDLMAEAGRSKVERAGLKLDERNAIRARSLEDFLTALTTRTPPIFEGDIATPSQLKNGVLYASLERIFRQARGVSDDMFAALTKDYEAKARREFSRSITVSGGLIGPSGGSFQLERR